MQINGEGLVLEGSYPVAIDVIDVIPGIDELEKIDKNNEKLLKGSALLEENVEFEDNSVGHQLKRQDLKINLVMDLVTDLLFAQNESLREIALTMTCRGMECKTDSINIAAGQNVKLSLFILPAFPKALILYGQTFVDVAKNKAFVIFEKNSLSTQVQEALEKLIFRQHRRKIALKKRS